MLHRWGRTVARRRRAVLGTALVAFAVAVLWGPGVVGALIGGGFDDPNAQSTRIETRTVQTVGRQGTDVVALFSSTTLHVDDPAFARAVEADLAALPPRLVTRTTTWWNSHAPALVSRDRHATAVLVQLSGADVTARGDQFSDIEKQLRGVGGGLTVQLGGESALNRQISHQVSSDLGRAETLSMPVLLVLLVLVFGSLVAASLPLVIGVFTVLGSFALLRLLAAFTQVSVFSINLVTLLGLGLAIDYALFVTSRFREELDAGADTPQALAITMATAGRTVLFSGITVATSLASLALFPQVFLRSMAYGGVAAVLLAMLCAVTVLPALLAVLGTRVNSLRLVRGRRGGAGTDRRLWARFASTVMRRPMIFAGATVAVLLALGLPFLRVQFGGIDSRALPAHAEGRVVDERLHNDFPGSDAYPIDVLVDGGGPAAGARFATAVTGLPGVRGVTTAASHGTTTLLEVAPAAGTLDQPTLDLVHDIRALPAPDGAQVLVGGSSARHVDLRHSIGSRLPLMAGYVVLATFVLLFLAFGSVILPIKAIAMNVLSLGASFGVVTWIFQDGHLSGLLDFTSTGTVETTQPILMLAMLFGLSMDYEVFLLSRIAERYRHTGDPVTAVADGLQRTGRIITSAALLLVVVIGAFSTSGITFIKLIGVGMAVAIVVDATLVRAVLVPALLRLLGHAAWWAPGPLRRWQERSGWGEIPTAEDLQGDGTPPERPLVLTSS